MFRISGFVKTLSKRYTITGRCEYGIPKRVPLGKPRNRGKLGRDFTPSLLERSVPHGRVLQGRARIRAR